MNAENLSKVGSRLVKRCGTRDPFSIARQLGIEVLFCEDFGPLKGMYRVIKRSRFIFINENLSGQMQRIVCAHELGHDQLHRNLAKGSAIQEFMLYDMTTKPEYEANIVAAEILLDTDEILEYPQGGRPQSAGKSRHSGFQAIRAARFRSTDAQNTSALWRQPLSHPAAACAVRRRSRTQNGTLSA